MENLSTATGCHVTDDGRHYTIEIIVCVNPDDLRSVWNFQRFKLIDRTTNHASTAEFSDAVRDGLNARPKTLPCRFFYDETGSKLFEQICDLPEYYLTRAER